MSQKPTHQTAASALSLSPSLSPSRTPSPSSLNPTVEDDDIDTPIWSRQQQPRTSSSSARRLSSRPYALHRHHSSTSSSPRSLPARALRTALSLGLRAQTLFLSLSPLYRILVALAGLTIFCLGITALIYSHAIFAFLAPIAKSWRSLPFGLGILIIFLIIFCTGFPPIIGYSSAVTLSGFVYGFPAGWPIAATATVAGSSTAFLASRGVLGGYVHSLVGKDKRFVALGQVLRRDGISILTMIRFCPLPYSLSNGFLATIPSVSVGSFALGTALSTPKLLVHVFIGSRLALLLEKGDEMTAGDKAINYAGMAFGAIVGTGVGLLIYRRTMARAAELEAEAGGIAGQDDGVAGNDLDRERDEESALMGGAGAGANVDAAALMDDDDISLWDNEGGYRDSWDEEEAVGENGRKP